MRFDDATLRAYVSGLLEPPEARQVAQWASRDPALRRRLTALAAQAMRPAPTPTRRFWLPPAGPHLVSDPDALGVLGGSMVLSGERFAVWLPTVEDAEDRTIVVLRRDEDETDWRVVEPLQPEAQVRLDALPVQEEGRRQLQLRAEGEGRQRWAVVLPAAETLDWTHDDPFRTLASLLHDNEVDAVSVRIEVQRRGGSGSSGGSGGSGPTDPDVAPSDPQVTRDATVPVQTQSVVSDEEVAGRYVLGPLIGAGGFGRVWAATDRLTGDEVALKRVPALSDQQERQVRAELAALRFARLPGVVRLRDEGRHGADWFLVMDRIAGRRFPGRVAGAEDERRAVTLYGDPVLTWAELRPRLLRLLEVLARVHAVGLVHRDLKPSNVLVDDEGAVTLLDFGLATGRATATGVSGFAGTPRYASPEQARRESVGPSSDLFSVGLMALEALGADLGDPFDVPSVLARRRAEPLPDVAALVPGLDDETVAWLNTMVAFDPAARLPTALDALRALGGPVAGGAPQLPEGTGPLTAMELRPLFAGPEAFLHLPEDSAAELWARTRGDRELVQAELEAWMRAGVAHLVDGQLQLDRAGIARLAAGMRTAVRRAAPTDGLSPEALRTLGYLELAWP
ncbi:MAG: serine/threonine protein kinase, partial [Myxococcales bacterium]|nr:serine/threonine protein kinase [Myxococcales bacterium]